MISIYILSQTMLSQKKQPPINVTDRRTMIRIRIQDGKHLYQWPAINECTRIGFVYGFEKHTPENTVKFFKMLQIAFLHLEQQQTGANAGLQIANAASGRQGGETIGFSENYISLQHRIYAKKFENTD